VAQQIAGNADAAGDKVLHLGRRRDRRPAGWQLPYPFGPAFMPR
jgi:hypothetical protein